MYSICTFFFLFYRPYSGKYLRQTTDGVYACIVCDNPLFQSEHKMESACGWAAFTDIIAQGKVTVKKDTTHGKMLTMH